jgi:N-acetylmuramoyl-L-alanine amidase
LYASSLTPPETEPRVVPWDSAQAEWVPQSLRLANEVGTSLARGHTPVLIHRADPKPLDNLTCPAIALELAPLPDEGDSTTPVNDTGYQQRVAAAVANALVFWKNHADPQPANGVAPRNDRAPSEDSPMEQPRPIQPLPPLVKPQSSTKPQESPKAAPTLPANRSPQPARRAAPGSSSLAIQLTASLEGRP